VWRNRHGIGASPSFDRQDLAVPRVALIHWNREVVPLAERLRAAGYELTVLSPQGMPGLRPVRDDPPDALVIDLERRPSDGREVGGSLRRLKATRQVPIIFAGGAPDKVERVRGLIPDAVFASWDDVAPAVEHALAHPPGAPVVPGTMDAYAGVGLSKKLGLKDGDVVALSGAPDGFSTRLEGVSARTSLRGRADLVVLFVREQAELERRLPAAIRAVADGGSLWIAWPKRASGIQSDLTQPVVRRLGMDAGLVDFKVASLDETWSGLRFVRRGR
jgi:hypothetical protein